MSPRVLKGISTPHRLLSLSILLICSTFGSTSTHRWASSIQSRGYKATKLSKLRGGAGFHKRLLSSSPKASHSSSSSINEDFETSTSKEEAREKLYEAYNLLHTLGKEFNLDIQAPSVLVVGHQSSGKSALIEALMGFQFNNVGGGTKTRRPIALHMRYNPECSEPTCYLTDDDTGKEHRMSLEEIQEHITAENLKLEADPNRCFDHREIVVRVEYRYCPNMVMVDTPGLISGARSEESRIGGGRFMNNHEKAHQQMVKEAENLVLNKMRSPEYIILCIEDTADWKHATTRSLVERADPTLSRTVIVNTKLDTKLMQFSDSKDVDEFIRAPLLKRLHPQLAGGPFFTSVPSGRVGKKTGDEFRTNEAFLRGLRSCERGDQSTIASKLGSYNVNELKDQLGVRRLRKFLEERVERSYRSNVAAIVPVLQAAFKRTLEAQAKAKQELAALSTDSLKDAANQYREHFSRSVADCIQGTISASPDMFGETLEEEEIGGGSFFGRDASEESRMMVDSKVAHATSKLYGGSQYHRSLREFALAVQHRALPEVTADEIANAAGVNDVHDGTNYMRAACVIAVAKAQDSFSPLLDSLQGRARHVMKRLFPIVTHMLDAKGLLTMSGGGKDSASMSAQKEALSNAVKNIFSDFVEDSLTECLKRCDDDLRGMTRFVTWDLQERGSLAVADALPTSEMVHIYAMSMKDKKPECETKQHSQPQRNQRRGRTGWGTFRGGGGDRLVEERSIVEDWETYNGFDPSNGYNNRRLTQSSSLTHEAADVLTLMEQVACMRDGNRTTKVVGALVQHIVRAWQLSFAQNVAMKFNCFYLLPFLDEFPFYLRSRLDKMYDAELSHLFDLRDAKQHLEKRLKDLDLEAAANKKLQSKFEAVNHQLSNPSKRSSVSDHERSHGIKLPEEGIEYEGRRSHDIPVATSHAYFDDEFSTRSQSGYVDKVTAWDEDRCASLLSIDDDEDAGDWWMDKTDE